jgi:hypothetical protein
MTCAKTRWCIARAREYMPRIQGLTAESVSVRRDRVIFKYSF